MTRVWPTSINTDPSACEMKPGVTMNTFGAGEYDPIFKTTVKPGLTDQQIADIVAYLQTLK